MDFAAFEKSPTGSLTPIFEAGQQSFAYVPYPLPTSLAELQPDHEVTLLLAEASRALGQLQGAASLLPKLLPRADRLDWLTLPYMRQEAVASVRIEGTYITSEEAQRYEVIDAPPEMKWSAKEVENYIRALRSGQRLLVEDNLPLSNRFVRDIHRTLMQGMPQDRAKCTPGEFRTGQVIIGRHGANVNAARFIPPPGGEVERLMQNWEVFCNDAEDLPTLIQCALMHYQFETIHPFDDGNGRVGRLLIKHFLLERSLLSYPILYLSVYMEHHRQEYQDSMLAVSRDGDWNWWLQFFLQGVVEQSQHSEILMRRIIQQREQYIEILQTAGVSPSTYDLLDHIFEQQTVTAKYVTEAIGVTTPTAQKAIDNLVDLGILTIDNPEQRRNRSYTALELLKLYRQPTAE